MGSSLTRVIAFSSEGRTPPTAPSAGNNYDWTDSRSTWSVLGSKKRGDLADLDIETVEITPRDQEEVMHESPQDPNVADITTTKVGPESVAFQAYNVENAVSALDSQVARSGNESQEVLETVWKSMVIETTGKLFEYFPRVKVTISGAPGSTREDKRLAFLAKVTGTDEIPSGAKKIWFSE